ncbi:transposase [Cupriavidus necator]|uniref:transposase n=1 Tax=Cupriavidus necator TaxID=106590 RepID=UPI003857BB06
MDCQTVAVVPGIGRLTATAPTATAGDAKAFKSGRELAAFLGLVPCQTGTAGKVQLGGISIRRDVYQRSRTDAIPIEREGESGAIVCARDDRPTSPPWP